MSMHWRKHKEALISLSVRIGDKTSLARVVVD